MKYNGSSYPLVSHPGKNKGLSFDQVERLILDFEKSGETISQYCKHINISPVGFKCWIKSYRRLKAENCWPIPAHKKSSLFPDSQIAQDNRSKTFVEWLNTIQKLNVHRKKVVVSKTVSRRKQKKSKKSSVKKPHWSEELLHL